MGCQAPQPTGTTEQKVDSRESLVLYEGDQVRICRVAAGILLQPFNSDTPAWFAELDRLNTEPFMKKGHKQPLTPRRDIFK